jgi:hypothetical protein
MMKTALETFGPILLQLLVVMQAGKGKPVEPIAPEPGENGEPLTGDVMAETLVSNFVFLCRNHPDSVTDARMAVVMGEYQRLKAGVQPEQ